MFDTGRLVPPATILERRATYSLFLIGLARKLLGALIMASLYASFTLCKDATHRMRLERQLRSEADGLLRKRVGEAFREFGEVGFVGSYALRLMTSRDLNIRRDIVRFVAGLGVKVAFSVGDRRRSLRAMPATLLP